MPSSLSTGSLQSPEIKPQPLTELDGVPETTLLTLWNRASFAQGRRKVLDDPLAVDWAQRVQVDLRQRFGRPYVAHAIRSRWFDEHLRKFLAQFPQGPVVALGEGLETQFWRVDNGQVNWYSVDLPQTLELRERLAPKSERIHSLAISALDLAWLEAVPQSEEIFISAAGLLMYFEEREVQTLLRRVVQHWPRGVMVFDTIPHWFSRKTVKGLTSHGYTYPPMPHALALDAIPGFLANVGMRAEQVLTYAEPYPEYMRVFSWLSLISSLRNRVAPGLVLASWDSKGSDRV